MKIIYITHIINGGWWLATIDEATFAKKNFCFKRKTRLIIFFSSKKNNNKTKPKRRIIIKIWKHQHQPKKKENTKESHCITFVVNKTTENFFFCSFCHTIRKHKAEQTAKTVVSYAIRLPWNFQCFSKFAANASILLMFLIFEDPIGKLKGIVTWKKK